jgi:hypothetical protein
MIFYSFDIVIVKVEEFIKEQLFGSAPPAYPYSAP